MGPALQVHTPQKNNAAPLAGRRPLRAGRCGHRPLQAQVAGHAGHGAAADADGHGAVLFIQGAAYL